LQLVLSSRDDAPAAVLYLPYAQAPRSLRGQAEIKVNTLVNPAVMIPAIRDQVQAVAVDMPPVKIVPDQELQDFESREERSLASLLAGFSALAFWLAILGLYGTVAYSVSQRMRELAIRFALGATQLIEKVAQHRSCIRIRVNSLRSAHRGTSCLRSAQQQMQRASYFALAGGTMPFIRRYSTIWP
jgi:hypothetical protein